MQARTLIPLLLGPGIFAGILASPLPAGMAVEAQAVLAVTLWMAVWWSTEVVHMAVTSMLPLILFPLTGALEIRPTAENYGHPLLFLFVGGFILALAMERWNLHRRIALSIIALLGTNARMIVLGFMVATGFLSMWISNTATTVMMLPIGMAIVNQFKFFSERNPGLGINVSRFSKALMLCIAYSASIGGVGTLIGTPTNVIFRGFVEEFYEVEFSFARWMLFAVPLSWTLLFLCWYYVVRIALPLKRISIPGIKQEITAQLKGLGKLGWEERWVLALFSLTALAWITRSYLLAPFLPHIDDTIIALIGAGCLFLIPARESGQYVMDWPTAVKLPWGILLLFGGGFAIAAGFQSSGLAQWIGEQMGSMADVSFILILLAITALVNFLTEVNSNMATCTMMMPILASLAPTIGVHPYGLLMAAGIASSCAFMLPVATAPNAVVFGSGYIRMKDMIRVGVALNLLSVALIVVYVYHGLPLVWGLDLQQFPAEFAK